MLCHWLQCISCNNDESDEWLMLCSARHIVNVTEADEDASWETCPDKTKKLFEQTFCTCS